MINLPKNIKNSDLWYFLHLNITLLYITKQQREILLRFENLISLDRPLLFSSKDGGKAIESLLVHLWYRFRAYVLKIT